MCIQKSEDGKYDFWKSKIIWRTGSQKKIPNNIPQNKIKSVSYNQNGEEITLTGDYFISSMAIKDLISNKKTLTYLFVYVSANEITHSQIWVFTPLLLLVGVPIEIVSLGWVLNFAMQTIGGKLSEKLVHLDVSKMYAIPMIIEFTWMIIIIVHVNIVTVWLFAFNGLVHGLARANLGTVLQNSAKDEVQTSVMSLASTFCRILYIPLVAVVNYFGNIQFVYALICVCVVFIPFFLINMIMLKKIKN